MIRYARFIALAAFLTLGIGGTWAFAGEPAPLRAKGKEGDDRTEGRRRKQKGREEGDGRQVAPCGTRAIPRPAFCFVLLTTVV
jgi:hypothetical protein